MYDQIDSFGKFEHGSTLVLSRISRIPCGLHLCCLRSLALL
jgi:hypothetical protein